MRVKHSFILLFTERLRFGAIIISSIILVASYFILLYTFISAYLSPIKTVTVNINQLGEAKIELIFLLVTIPCIAYYLKNLSWSSKKKRLWIDLDE